MKTNATFKYKNASVSKTNGYMVVDNSEYVKGGACYVSQLTNAYTIVGTGGNSYKYSYEAYVETEFYSKLHIGTKMLFTTDNGDTIEATIYTIENLNKVLYLCLS